MWGYYTDESVLPWNSAIFEPTEHGYDDTSRPKFSYFDSVRERYLQPLLDKHIFLITVIDGVSNSYQEYKLDIHTIESRVTDRGIINTKHYRQ